MLSLIELEAFAHIPDPESDANAKGTRYTPDPAEIDLLHNELLFLLQKFTASSGVVSCRNLLFEQVQSSHIRNSKKNRKLLRVLAIYHKYWIDHQPFHENHTDADFQTFWEEDFQSYKYVVNEFTRIQDGKTFEDEKTFNALKAFMKKAATWKEIIIWGHSEDDNNPVCACLVKFAPSDASIKTAVLCNFFANLPRQGYGGTLLRQVTELCINTHSVDYIEAFVRLDDKQEGIIRFYERYGFQQAEIDYDRIDVGEHGNYEDTVRLLFDCHCNTPAQMHAE